jgi:hypothetical protein
VGARRLRLGAARLRRARRAGVQGLRAGGAVGLSGMRPPRLVVASRAIGLSGGGGPLLPRVTLPLGTFVGAAGLVVARGALALRGACAGGVSRGPAGVLRPATCAVRCGGRRLPARVRPRAGASRASGAAGAFGGRGQGDPPSPPERRNFALSRWRGAAPVPISLVTQA